MERTDERAVRFRKAVESSDGDGLRALFAEHPDLVEVIDEPWFAFDCPAIVWATKSGNQSTIDALLDLGADPDAKSQWAAGGYGVLDAIVDRPAPVDEELAEHLMSRGASLDIHAAAGLGRLDRLTEVLDASPDRVSEPGPDGATPLHLAKNPEVAAFLLERGAEIDKRCVDHKSTAAQWSVSGREAVTRFLLDEGARPDLFMAAVLDDVALAERLLADDPEAISVRVRPGQSSDHVGGGDKYVWALDFAETPLEVARRRENHAVYRFLLERSPPLVRLLHAARRGDLDEVRSRMADGDPPLSEIPEPLACDLLKADLAAARIFLEAGLDANARDDDTGGTAAHHAAWHGDRARLELLLDHGLDLTIRDRRYLATPLGWANEAGHDGLVKWLATVQPLDIVDAAWLGDAVRTREILEVDHDAVRGFGDGGAYPLRAAVWCGHEEVVRLLLDAGADPEARHPESGKHSVDLAEERGHEDILELLRR